MLKQGKKMKNATPKRNQDSWSSLQFQRSLLFSVCSVDLPLDGYYGWVGVSHYALHRSSSAMFRLLCRNVWRSEV